MGMLGLERERANASEAFVRKFELYRPTGYESVGLCQEKRSIFALCGVGMGFVDGFLVRKVYCATGVDSG